LTPRNLRFAALAILFGGAERARRGAMKRAGSPVNSPNGVIEYHTMTVLPTMHAFAEVARALVGRGVPQSDIGLIVHEAAFRSSSAPRGAPGPATFALLPEGRGEQRIAASAGHVFDRFAETLRAGVADLPSVLATFVSRRDADRLAAAIARGCVLLWTMTASIEAASWIAAVLLAHSAERVCTFTRPPSSGGAGRGSSSAGGVAVCSGAD
jgi:hypothetical protein